jgi:hypothetical protein
LVIDKKTLKSLKWVRTDIRSALAGDDSTFEITNKKTGNFMAFPTVTVDGMRVIAFGLNSSSNVSSEQWFISPPLAEICDADTFRCKGGALSNGRLAFWTEETSLGIQKLFVQPLGPLGEPVLDPVLIDRIKSRSPHLSTIGSADASKSLSGQKRFLVYTRNPIPGRSSLILQHINADTGHKIGESIALFRGDALRGLGNVKIDPRGRFVLFILGNDLTYLALDPTGHASGTPKLLAGNAIAGIDLLRDVVK